MSQAGKITTTADARTYMLAGKATVTLVSVKTGTRFTYTIKAGAAEPPDVWFVSVLTGSDNEEDYRYLGRIDARMRFWAGRRTPKPGDVGPEAPSSKAFAWAWSTAIGGGEIPATLQIWHEGRCGRCARKLTVPSSIASGMGPECANKVGFVAEEIQT